ncbi:hypothetical protein GCM10027261_36190 [Geodermatophilus arenarius]|uniref:DUF2334 domain-containing protein n=1 Tax=Geodermatophilus arenarius TaxID=1137990 RepID=A0ABV9LLE8_9ACTN
MVDTDDGTPRPRILVRWFLALVVCAAFFSSAVLVGLSTAVPVAPAGPHRADLSGLEFPSSAVRAPLAPSGTASSLVLYDDTGEFLPLSQLYGTLAAALASHFGTPHVHGISTYAPGEMGTYRGVVYLGTNADQVLPPSFVADVRNGGTPVLWLGANLDELPAASADLRQALGMTWLPADPHPAPRVAYKGAELSRPADAGAPAGVTVTDPARVQVLAETVHEDGSRTPWAVRSGALIYVAEVALDPAGESGDRYLVVCDLFFDLLRPDTTTRHRALVRLEDVNPLSDPGELRRQADALDRAGVPFSFALYPVAVDGLEAEPRRTVRLSERPDVVEAVAYMIQRGGTMVLHGYTHQFGAQRNPDTGGSGADFEFFRVDRTPDGALVYQGPVPGDSPAWATDRLESAIAEVTGTGLPRPRVFEFPHYAASSASYEAAGRLFDARYDRPYYLSGGWRAGPMNDFLFAQYAPYVVRDGYGSTVIPENLGFVEGPPVPVGGPGSMQAIVDGARSNLVVRDGVASFFYHPYLGTERLEWIIDRFQELGYEFVPPGEL